MSRHLGFILKAECHRRPQKTPCRWCKRECCCLIFTSLFSPVRSYFRFSFMWKNPRKKNVSCPVCAQIPFNVGRSSSFHSDFRALDSHAPIAHFTPKHLSVNAHPSNACVNCLLVLNVQQKYRINFEPNQPNQVMQTLIFYSIKI